MPSTLDKMLKEETVVLKLNQVEWFIMEKTLDNTGTGWKGIKDIIREFTMTDIPDEEFEKAAESLNDKLSEAYPF